VADRDRKRVGGVVRLRKLGQAEDRLHHLRHLRLVGVAIATDGLFDTVRRVFNALDADGRRRDEYGAPRLPDGERDAGVGADVRLLQGDDIRAVLRNQLLHPVEDRAEPELQALRRGGLPPSVADGSEAPVALVYEPVPASSRPWIDAENFHEERLWSDPDVPG